MYTKWFKNPTYFRYGFLILMILTLILRFTNLHNNGIYLFFSITAIFLGLGFYNKSIWFLVLFTFMLVSIGVFHLPLHPGTITDFVILLCNDLLTVFISAGLMKNFQKVKSDNLELTKALSNALDSRDTYTLFHSENVAKYALAIAKKMNLSQPLCDTIYLGGLLHDIGKIGIPEHILKKPSQLSNEEYSIIKTHPLIGYEMIKHVSEFHGNGVLDIILYHHERYDGTGYPKGLKGDEIPLAARIITIADSFDAMTSSRVYKQEIDSTEAINEIKNNKGKQFDPEIVDVFLSLYDINHHESIPSLKKSC